MRKSFPITFIVQVPTDYSDVIFIMLKRKSEFFPPLIIFAYFFMIMNIAKN